jgi:hypothetical protein
MRRGAPGEREQSATGGHGVFGDHGVLRQERGQRKAKGLGLERSTVEFRLRNRGPRRHGPRCAEFVGQRFQSTGDVLLRTGQREHRAILRPERARLSRIGEEADRRFCAREHQAACALQQLERRVHHVGNPVHRRAPLAARHARHLRRRAEFRPGRMGDAQRGMQPSLAQGPAGEHQHRTSTRPQCTGDGGHLAGRDLRRGRRRDRDSGFAAFVPRAVRRQDQRGRPAGRRTGRLYGGRSICADRAGIRAGAHPARHRSRQGFSIRGQRRVVGPVIGRMITDDIDDRGKRALRVVQVGKPVGKARPAMKQRRRRPAGHAPVAVGATGHHRLGQAKHAAQSRHAVERGNEMHFRGARIREAGIHAAGDQRAGEAFCAVHAWMLASP